MLRVIYQQLLSSSKYQFGSHWSCCHPLSNQMSGAKSRQEKAKQKLRFYPDEYSFNYFVYADFENGYTLIKNVKLSYALSFRCVCRHWTLNWQIFVCSLVQFFFVQGKFGGKKDKQSLPSKSIYSFTSNSLPSLRVNWGFGVFMFREINVKIQISAKPGSVCKKCSYGIIFQKHSSAAQKIDHFYPSTF